MASPPSTLTEIMALASDDGGAALPSYPVHRWNPAHCGSMDLVIAADGRWVHEGRPILRPALLRLFAALLRREGDGSFVLVTPAEKLTITVEDAPFVIVDIDEGADELVATTAFGERVTIGPDHPLTMRPPAHRPGDEPLAYVTVRDGLEGRLSRAAWLRLVDQATLDDDGVAVVRSGDSIFALGAAR